MTIKETMQLSEEQFWSEVSRAISPKPWKHVWRSENPGWICAACGEMVEHVGHMSRTCPVPPPLTDSPEVLAFRLRDRVLQHAGVQKLETAVQHLCGGGMTPIDSVLRTHYMAYGATPRDIVMCALAALGLWEVTP